MSLMDLNMGIPKVCLCCWTANIDTYWWKNSFVSQPYIQGLIGVSERGHQGWGKLGPCLHTAPTQLVSVIIKEESNFVISFQASDLVPLGHRHLVDMLIKERTKERNPLPPTWIFTWNFKWILADRLSLCKQHTLLPPHSQRTQVFISEGWFQ